MLVEESISGFEGKVNKFEHSHGSKDNIGLINITSKTCEA